MKRPEELESLTPSEERGLADLESEIEEHFADGTPRPYRFDPDATCDPRYTERVLRAAIKKARKAGWQATDLDTRGSFTVQRP